MSFPRSQFFTSGGQSIGNNRCRFSNCTHTHEPGCLVREAVENGEIAAHRYENYLNILNDNDMNIAPWELK